ncbi:MAG: HepT-like ribonuclease domain-containing protein [Patescibacteria group bacterium]
MKQAGLSIPINALQDYFSKREDVLMAFVFGSQAKKSARAGSDWDIAVYFKPESGRLECEEEVFYKQEAVVWNDLESILKCPVDLIILNRAPATLAFPIINKGEPIIIKNKSVYLKFLLAISSLAIDFRQFMRDFRTIKARSRSLNIEDKDNLIKLLDFIETELNDFDKYKNLDFATYTNNREKKRSVERWVENIVNASIDIAKILLASEKKQLPDTYGDILKLLVSMPNFSEEISNKLAFFVGLRNLMAHEYLDLRFSQIQEFIKEVKIYRYLIEYTDNFLKKN